jgi:thymidylate synthase (FAD)
MEIQLLNRDFIKQQYLIAVKSARNCYDSVSDSDIEIGGKDKQLMKNLMKSGHHTIFEHIDLVLDIKGASRSVLQQWSRHRLQSQNVKSTRYTLDKMLIEFKIEIEEDGEISQDSVDKYFVDFYGSKMIINNTMKIILDLGFEFNKSTNDKLKYLFPEALKTEIVSKINLRSFINMYRLRRDKHAMQEFQDLVYNIYDILPDYIQDLIDIGVVLND